MFGGVGMERNYKVANLFAGVGGICRGFEKAGGNIIWTNEIDRYACKTYSLNMNSTVLAQGIYIL